MDKMNLGYLNMKPLVDDLIQKMDDASSRLQSEGQEAGEAIGRGFDDGTNYTVEKIKASSIKTDKAFKNLSEKIKKQVQQLATSINGKDTKIKIDFSDININSDTIQKQIEKKVKSIKVDSVIDFDTKDFDSQLTNFVTLFVKYEEKLKMLKQDYPNISVPKDAINNLQQQFALITELKQMHKLLNKPIALHNMIRPQPILKELSKLQQFADNTKPQSLGEYNKLAEVLREIQASLKIVSNAFENENNSMKAMAESGVTSFENFSQAIIAVYNNLTQVKELVDNISKKDFNIVNTISFDDIYTKFDELRKNISFMKIDVGVDTTNITNAIKEALYAEDIAKNYKQVEFEDIYEAQFDKGTWTNKWTGEIFNEFEKVDDDFETAFKDLFMSKEGYFLGTKEEMFADLLSKQSISSTPEQNDWAQVIVEAINTQGGNIVEAIKIVLPKNVSDNINNTNSSINETELAEALKTLSSAISIWNEDTGRFPGSFFQDLLDNRDIPEFTMTSEITKALSTLGLLSNSGEPNFVMPKTGMRNLGVAIADDTVLNVQISDVISDIDKLKTKLDEAYQLGAAIPRILAFEHQQIDEDGAIFQLQSRAYGSNVHNNDDFTSNLSHITDEQIDKILHTFEVLSQVELFPDFIGDNIMFDEKKGFSLVDLDTRPLGGVDTPDDMVNGFLRKIKIESGNSKQFNNFANRVNDRFNMPPEQRLVNSETIVDKRAQSTSDVSGVNAKITPTMDDGAIARLVDENVAKTPATVKVTPIIDKGTTSGQASISENELENQINKYLDFVRNDDSKNSGESDDKLRQLFSQYPLLQEFDNKTSLLTGYETIFGAFDPDFDVSKLVQQFKDFVQYSNIAIQNPSIMDTASESQQLIDAESQSAIDAAKSFVDAANAKKQFVEANKQVAKSAEESAEAVEEEAKAAKKAKETMMVEADDTKLLTDWDKEIKLQEGHDEDPFAMQRTKTANVGDESVRTIVETWSLVKDEDGELTGEMELNTVKIINDFKKRTDAITKESEKIKTAQAYLQKFLTQFNNKTMGKGNLLSGYQDLEVLAKSPDFKIDDIAKAEQMMSNLDAEYNKVVQSMRKGSSSMNPFVNAINGMDKMEDILRGISLQFKTLNQQPKWLKNQIIDLYKQLDSVSAETDIYKFAEGFGNLKVSINSVVETIRQQRVEQKLALSDFNALVKATKTRDANTEKAAKEEDGSAWKTYYTDRAAEQQKIIDTIGIGLALTEAQETQLNAMAEKHALILSDITSENNKIEEQKQKYEEIMRLLEKNQADQVEFDNDKSLDTSDRSAYQQILNQERAEIEALIAGTDLNPEQSKSVNGFVKSIENDRIAKVKEYIDLLKLQQDYEKKAVKEDDGSNMQSFYNEQIEKVKEKIKNINIKDIANQEEKNKLLVLEETHQRAIAEIIEKKNSREKDPVTLFSTENKNIENKYEAGYLNKDSYINWQKELAEYRNYMSGVTKADETTIQNKKQSLLQMYDMLTKMSNASKSFFASGGEILPKEMWFDETKLTNVSKSLNDLYGNIVSERFEGMKTSITGVNENLGKLNFTVDDGKGSLSQYTIVLNKATGATKLLSNTTKPTLTIFQKFGQTLKKDFTGILHATMGGTGVYAFVRYMRQGIEAVRELDLALTELKKVTDETEETYDRFLDTASKTSARIGKTITEMTSATAEFAKLGYDIEQASLMAESALVYANVGDNVDVETGSQSIISTLKAFGIEADNTMSIVDKFNEVGNNFAITTKGIGDALQVSASAMAAAGNSLDETIALTTAANTIVQNPNTVGTALKTLSLRIRGVKTELEEAGLETEGMAETTSQLQAKLLALTDGKVNIMLDEDNFKNTTQILREMSAEWEHMTDVEQAAALELLGGKRQANTLSAIISNFDIVENAIKASANSAGSALEENAKVLDSIQGRINLFNNALQTMWNNALDSSLIKDVVSLGTEIVKIADDIGLINSALIALGAYKGFGALFKSLKDDGITLKSVWTWVNQLTLATRQQQIADAAAVGTTLSRMNAEELLNISIVKRFATEQLDAKVKEANMTRDVVLIAAKQALALAEEQYAEGLIDDITLQSAKNAVDAASVPITASQIGVTGVLSAMFKGLAASIWSATKAIAAFLFTNLVGWAILAVGAIAGVVAIFNATHKTAEELGEELDELNSKISDTKSEIDSLNTELKTTRERMAELLALPSLSFVDEEELRMLQARETSLEHQLELQEHMLESQNAEKAQKAKDYIGQTWDSESIDKEYYVDSSGVIHKDEGWNGFWETGKNTTDALDTAIRLYESSKERRDQWSDVLSKWNSDDEEVKKQIRDYYKASFLDEEDILNNIKAEETQMENIKSGINMVLGDVNFSNLTYGMSDDIDNFLDEYYSYQLKWQKAQGEYINSKAISSMFDSSASEEMQELGKELQNIADDDILTDDQKNSKIQERINKIDETNEAYSRLNDTMRITGVTAQDIADYFVLETGAYDSNTIEGITKQYADAFNVMRNLKSLANGDVSNQLTKLGADGKVDLLNRPQIETSKLADAGWGDVGGDYATVFTNTYSNEDGTVAMNFTPILPNGSVLSPDELEKYAESVVAGAEDTKGLKIGATFEGENAIEQAVEVAEEIHNLQELYYGMSWDELFTINEDGKFEAQADKFSEILTGIDEDCRRTFMSLATSVKNGELSWEQAMKSFEHSGNLAGLKIIEAQIIELNNTEFSNISDELSGVIDTFGELSAALDDVASSMELLNTAQTQMNNAGQISVKTALEIMQTTDQWNDILEIENGNIKLVGNATEILVEDKIALIKANLQNALATVTEQLAMVDSQNASEDLATTMEESTNQAVRKLAGSMAYLAKMTEAYTRAANGESIDVDAYMSEARAKQEEVEKELNWKLNSANKIGKGDLEKRKAEIEAQLAMLEGIDTASEFKNNYDFDKTPGDKYKDSSSGSDDAFQKAMDYWENRIAANQAKYEQIQNEIDLLEKQGKTAGEDYYKEQVKLENERLKLLQGQRAEAQKHLKRFKEGSDEWWEVASTLNDIESEIDGVTLSLQDLSDTIAQIKWDVFEKSHTRFDNLKGQLETVRELVAPNNEEDWFEDGMWTEKGVAVAGTYIQEIEIDENALEDTQKKLADFAKGYKGNEKYFKNTYGLDSEQEYYDKRQELIEQEQEYAKNINSNKQAVIDMYEAQIDAVEEYTSKLIDSYNEYIDTVKEAIDAERELYEFKKDVAKQTKDIGELERRIASLSGSDNAADIAERRKLEAELTEAKEGLNDSYYSHSKDALQDALEEEANAYEETMNKFIEELRKSLETALQDMDLFMEGVFNSVITNAPSILEQYNSLGLALDDAITNPWKKASEAITKFDGVDGLGIMNTWINEGGIFPTFKTSAEDALKSPWEAGKKALGSFKQSVDTEMKNIVKTIESNVSSAKTKLNSLTSTIHDTSKTAPATSSSSGNSSSSGYSSSGGSTGSTQSIKVLQEILNDVFFKKLTVDGKYGSATKKAVGEVQIALKQTVAPSLTADGLYGPATRSAMAKWMDAKITEMKNGQYGGSSAIGQGVRFYTEQKNKLPAAFYAKGTLGTKRDEFAITDESWIGEEITLAAGKNGQLQYLKKGSAVMPADISANLVEWGKLNPNMMNIANPSAGINLMTNYVSKPELNLSFDALVKAGTITQEALPAVKELVKQELDRFTKQLNYSIKRVGAN